MDSFKTLSFGKKLVIIAFVGLVFSIILLINWSIFKILGFIVGSLASGILIFLAYYYSMRNLVRMLTFPGITIMMKKSLENDYCKSMAQGVLR